MRKIGLMAVFIPAVLLLTSLPQLNTPSAAVQTGAGGNAVFELLDEPAPAAELAATDTFRVKRKESGKVETLSANDYICGVLCGEMPSSFSDEALKAQAVAAYTFACRRRQTNSADGYDVTDDYTVDQCYISPEDAAKKWGDSAEATLERYRKLVSEVSGYMVTYEGKAALTVYHATSGGKTQNVSDVWGGSLPYLCGTDSPGDATAANYVTTVQYTADEVSKRISGLCSVSGDSSQWFGKTERTAADYVKSVSVCGKSITGAQLRAALELRSNCFDISFADGKFTFTVRGSGHGVGMSQTGADAMARQGSGYEEILCHYYPGCKVEKVK